MKKSTDEIKREDFKPAKLFEIISSEAKAILAEMKKTKTDFGDNIPECAIRFAMLNPKLEHKMFWTEDERKKCTIKFIDLMDFLMGEGFFIYGVSKIGTVEDYDIIKADGNIIELSSDGNARRFVSDWIKENIEDNREQNIEDNRELLEAFAKIQYQINKSNLRTHLKNYKVKPHRDDSKKVFIYYQNGFLEITKDGYVLKPYCKLSGALWKTSIQSRLFAENTSKGEFEKFFWNINNKDKDRYDKMRTGFAYLVHKYKNKAEAKAIIFNDDSLDDQQGGSGKGIIINDAIKAVRKIENIDCKTRPQNQFFFAGITPATEVVHLEDTLTRFNFTKLFNAITSTFEVEDKGKNRFSIPFEESPKIAISTNYVIGDNSSSVKRRKVDYVIHRHYSNEFTPADDFGHNLLADNWPIEEWNKFDTWVAKAVQYYLKRGLQEGENKTVVTKMLARDTSNDFVKFMNEKVIDKNREYIKSDFYMEFIDSTDADEKKITPHKVTKWLTQWAKLKGYQYNEKQKRHGTENKRCFWIE